MSNHERLIIVGNGMAGGNPDINPVRIYETALKDGRLLVKLCADAPGVNTP